MAENTLQTNIKENTQNITQYSLFLGGLNVKSDALAAYDPLKTGYARIFFMKMPKFMETILPNKTKKFKHLLEYGFVGVDGIGNVTLDFEQITGGYAGKSFDVASVAKDETTSITVKVYEFSGSPVREYTEMWISGISDPFTGIGHYHGAMDIDSTLKYAAVNHTAEAIYVSTDPTGRSSGIEYACLLTNMIPKTVKKDHFNYTAGEHQIVQTDIEFTVVKYESSQINTIAKALMDKFNILRDFLNFDSGYTTDFVNKMTGSTITDWSSGKTDLTSDAPVVA